MLTPPSNFTLTDGLNAGELKSSVKRSAGARGYVHEYTLEPPTEDTTWVSKSGTSREYVFSGLPAGTRVYCRVAAFGSKNQYLYTSILSRVVQ